MSITKRISAEKVTAAKRPLESPYTFTGKSKKTGAPDTGNRPVTKISEATKKALARAIIERIKSQKSENNYKKLAGAARRLADMWEKRTAIDPKALAQKEWKTVWKYFIEDAKKGRLDEYVDEDGVLNCTDEDELSNYTDDVYVDEFDGDFLQEAHDFLRDYG